MLQIKDIMTQNVFAVPEDQTLNLAKGLMELEEIRHVPVVDANNRFVGLITRGDLFNRMITYIKNHCELARKEEIHLRIPIKSVMKRDVVTVDPQDTVVSAIPILLDHRFGCLPVVSDGLLVGIVTYVDFLKMAHEILKSSAVDFSVTDEGLSARCFPEKT